MIILFQKKILPFFSYAFDMQLFILKLDIRYVKYGRNFLFSYLNVSLSIFHLIVFLSKCNVRCFFLVVVAFLN